MAALVPHMGLDTRKKSGAHKVNAELARAKVEHKTHIMIYIFFELLVFAGFIYILNTYDVFYSPFHCTKMKPGKNGELPLIPLKCEHK